MSVFDELPPGNDRQLIPAEKIAPLLPESILPQATSRHINWRGMIQQFAKSACAIPYRWATANADVSR